MSESLLPQYAETPSRYDEMVDEGHVPRPHWRGFLSHLAALPAETIRERARFVRDAIRSDGVTYNVYADPKGRSRPWELDLLPFILSAEEWRPIAAAVAQRARLLNAILGDLYGPQTLLADGLIPPALVFGQRTFLWPAHGVVPPDGVALHIYAVDVARAPDGRWWVLSDRTHGPSGAGYALQNRITLLRAFPDAFRELHVEQLAPFFGALQDTLMRAAPTDGEAPLAVLLTPGPFNETYFEHSFLARHLGFPLVEGQDLLVRGSTVYLKTLRGLRRVHAILRRLDDDFCDPVELRPDSALGVPGLMHAVRAGNVVLANALGSGVLETSALHGFLPAICERLLGERLAMPSIATWWCGEAPALDYVTSHLDDLVIKPTYPSMRVEPVFGHLLDAAGRAETINKLQVQSHAYVAQEWVRLSHAPTWDRETERLVARATTIRVFAVATPTGYMVLPGGLTRVATHDGDVVSMQWGGSSKDTWILADAPVTRVPLQRPRLGAVDVTRSGVDTPSRVGENLFWMGRYAERCEGIARLLRSALARVTDVEAGAAGALASIGVVCEALEVVPSPDDREEACGRGATPDFLAAATDPDIPGGIVANVLRLHAAASHVRERMSNDNWHVLSRLVARLPERDAPLGAALESLDETMLACVSLAGFALDDMTRDESWHFVLVGRRLERLAHIAGVLERVVALDDASRDASLEWILEIANSIVTYRARYRRAPELLPVVHLVALDETNPHAIAFQVRELATTIDRGAAALGGDFVDTELEPLSAALRAYRLEALEAEPGAPLQAACAELAALLVRAQRVAFALSDALHRRYFTHVGRPEAVGFGTP